MTREQAKREIDSLDFYLQNHTDDYGEESHTAMMMAIKALEQQTCEDAVSRNLITETLNKMDRYVAEELTLCDTDKKFPKNEVFIVDDVYEQIVEQLPSVQPKTTVCEDVVSRQAVLDIFADNADAVRPYSKTWEEVKDLPSVNPQPKTGHWIEEDRYIDGYDDTIEILQCSLCGFKHHYTQGDTSKTDSTWYNYCPNCGSGMVEPQESEG